MCCYRSEEQRTGGKLEYLLFPGRTLIVVQLDRPSPLPHPGLNGPRVLAGIKDPRLCPLSVPGIRLQKGARDLVLGPRAAVHDWLGAVRQ